MRELYTTLGLFKLAGADFESIQELMAMGIYITTTLKIPRDKSKEAKKPLTAAEIKEHIPILEEEMAENYTLLLAFRVHQKTAKHCFTLPVSKLQALTQFPKEQSVLNSSNNCAQ